jgi:SAM-dependent methyltransferase
MMSLNDQQQVAQAFGVTPELVPLLPELLADIWVLGSWPGRIVELLREFTALPRKAGVVELGCGKGAVAVPVAQELDFRVLGIDLCPPFIEEAEARAASAGVADLCRFQTGDLRDAVQTLAGYDVALLAGVGAGVLGDFARCVGEMRRIVRRGGYLVIDDGFLNEATRSNRPGYEYYRSRDDTVLELTSHGDRLVRELLVPRGELEEYNQRNTDLIRSRTKEIAKRRPELAEALSLYVQSEEAECEFLEARTTPAVWLLERS